MHGRAPRSTTSRPLALALLAGLTGCSFPRSGLGVPSDLGTDTGSPAVDVGTGDTSVVDSGAPAQGDSSIFEVDPADAADGDGASVDADGAADADAGCKPPSITDPCKGMVKLRGAQLLDGDDSDFACVPTSSFVVKSAPLVFPTPAADVPEVAHVRAAWTNDGLAIYVRVDDPTVVVAPIDDSHLFDGDAVELYLSGNGVLTGAYDRAGADPASVQLVVAPYASGIAARGEVYANTDKGTLDPSYFTSKTLATGYAIELALPWSFLLGAGAAGAHVGFDVAIDVNDDPSAPTSRVLWGLEYDRPIGGKTSCAGTTTPYAWCDDRIWCAPVLE